MCHTSGIRRISFRILAPLAAILISSVDASAATKMYWGDTTTNSIYRANLDGSGLESVVSFPLATDPLRRGIQRLAIDAAAGSLYWTNNDLNLVQRANLDGSDVTTLVDLSAFAGTDTPYPLDIELDLVHRKIYWTMNGLYRANLDGSQVEPLITDTRIYGVDIDHANQRLFLTSIDCSGDSSGDCVHRADLDGSNLETLITDVGGDIDAIEVDAINGKMYYSDEDSGRIYEADLDGSNNRLFYATSTVDSGGHGLAIDPQHQRLYWSSSSWRYSDPLREVVELRGSVGFGDLTFADPNGEFSQTLFSGGLPKGIVLDDPLPVPEPASSSLVVAAIVATFSINRWRRNRR